MTLRTLLFLSPPNCVSDYNLTNVFFTAACWIIISCTFSVQILALKGLDFIQLSIKIGIRLFINY